jgi:hypothetical protein
LALNQYPTSLKLRWLVLQNDVKWNVQMDKMLSKASSRLYMLCTLKHFGFPLRSSVLCIIVHGYQANFAVRWSRGRLQWWGGYQARPWTHKKHPRQVFLNLKKLAPLNK